VDLSFIFIRNILSKRGCQQGMPFSGAVFAIILWSVIVDIINAQPKCDWGV